MYKNLPSEFPQHSELYEGLFVRNTQNKPISVKRLSVCQTNIPKLCFKLVAVHEDLNYILLCISY